MAPTLALSKVGGGTIDLATMKGNAVWVNFMGSSATERSAGSAPT
ncbi:MAG TPA: hypothetical protein VK233_07030 [Candidatus Dormibacteraeota bacterium]|nr:hypothetical protein [Candidatus Limnocylindrales bacterium]HLQ48711.1 hypothetical protein [Candidatus Dormibacteraeota bacterium]